MAEVADEAALGTTTDWLEPVTNANSMAHIAA